MTMDQTHNEKVDRILRHLRHGLGARVLHYYKRQFPNSYLKEISDCLTSDSWAVPEFSGDEQALAELDLHAQLKLMRKGRRTVFEHLNYESFTWVNELWNARNDRAHETDKRSFDEARMKSVASAAHQLLMALNAPSEAQEIERELVAPYKPDEVQQAASTVDPVPLAAPLVRARVSDNVIRLSWHPVRNAGQYALRYRKSGAARYGKAQTMTTLGCTLTKLAAATKYSVQVRAEPSPDDMQYKPGEWGLLETQTLERKPVTLEVPVVGAVPSETFIELKWKRVSGAVGYEVRFRREDRQEYARVSVTHTNSFRIQGLVASTTYVVQVRANSGKGDGIYHPSEWYTLGVVTAAPPQVVRIDTPSREPLDIPSGTCKCERDRITLNWKAVKRADGYEVRHRKAGTSTFGPAVRLSGTTWTIRNLEAGTTYSIQLRAVPAQGDRQHESGPWHSVSVATKATADTPSGAQTRQPVRTSSSGAPFLSGRLTATGIKLSWSPVRGATGYELTYRAPGSTSYHTNKTDASTFTKLLPGWRRLEIRVRAMLATANDPYRKGEWSERRVLGE